MLPKFLLERHTIHGSGWKVPWNVCEFQENIAVLAYLDFADVWPFPYLAHLVFELNGSTLRVNLQITNTGKSAIPAGMGLHPYFVLTTNFTITAKTEKCGSMIPKICL